MFKKKKQESIKLEATKSGGHILIPLLLYVKYVKIVDHQHSTILFITVCCLEYRHKTTDHGIKLLVVPKYYKHIIIQYGRM